MFLERVANAFALGTINLVKVLELPLDNLLRNALHGLGESGLRLIRTMRYENAHSSHLSR
jgi:hypothetical protein